MMADISKCLGKDCPLKDKCYRYLAVDGGWQSYFTEIPFDNETNNCKYFIERF
jgi:hypothetical protein